MSQMPSTRQRIAAIVFYGDQTTLYLYYFGNNGFQYYGHKKFGYDYLNMMTGVEVTAKGQVVITFLYGKRLEVYRVEDIRVDQEKPAKPLSVIDARVMAFFGIPYFAPLKTKISIYHDQVTFIQTKTGVMALNINQQGWPQLLFHTRTLTSKYDFQINSDTLIIITQSYMALYRLTLPLQRTSQPFLLQKYTSDYNLNQYDEINSDGLFYLVQKQDTMILVLHPNMPATSIIYVQFYVGKAVMIDAVRLGDKEVLFVYNGSAVLGYIFVENPRLRINWQPYQTNFSLQLTATNQQSKSQPYTTLFSILDTNQAKIQKTDKFNETAIRRSGLVAAKRNSKIITHLNVTLNDSDWFTGNVMHYEVNCQHCRGDLPENQFQISLQNHMKQLNTSINIGGPVFDMKSTFQGIYGQMYNSSNYLYKTYPNKQSIEYLLKIPTTSRGQVCTKLAVNTNQDYILSFCQTGQQVNIYITTSASKSPIISGPYITQAQAVNHVQIVNNIVMIVDNDDDPFTRAGGVYLYYIDVNAMIGGELLAMLDYIDYQDLQIQGFRGIPHIASADLHKPMFNKDQYVIFLTQSRTGNIFTILFQISTNKKQLIYLQKHFLDLNKLIPESIQHPIPLRVININIIDYTVRTVGQYKVQYVLLLTVRNWHHLELLIVFDQDYDILSFQLQRLFQRVAYPWQLTNFMRLRKGSINASYFAVSYRDYQSSSQLIVAYDLPYFNLPDEPTPTLPGTEIPITPTLAAHRIPDTAQITFDFNTRDQHRIIFNDASSPNLNQLQLNKQLKLIIRNADPVKNHGENITIIAENHYMNVSFVVQFGFDFQKDDQDRKKVQTEIIWIVILVIGGLVIIGLIVVWARQRKGPVRESTTTKQSLLTIEPEFKSNFINRSSADPESVRNTVDLATPLITPTKQLQRQEIEEEETPKA